MSEVQELRIYLPDRGRSETNAEAAMNLRHGIEFPAEKAFVGTQKLSDSPTYRNDGYCSRLVLSRFFGA